MKPQVLCVVGPTASGKTALSVELALRYGGEVVSCDSMQVYRGMDIGAAKPAPGERQGVPHHMLDVADPSEPYSAARYAEEAARCVEDILARGKLPVVCGGTGLYLNALLLGLHDAGSGGVARAALLARLESEGPETLYAELKAADPSGAAHIHPHDTRRVIRALEVFHETGQPLSSRHRGVRGQTAAPRWDALILGLDFADRARLYERIDRRVDQMLAAGLPDEARALFDRRPPPCPTALQAIGYKELAGFLDGTQTLEQAAETLKRATRRLAKRQLTWFRASPGIVWLNVESSANESADAPRVFGQATQIAEKYGLL